MNSEFLISEAKPDPAGRVPRWVIASISLISAAAIGYEILLVRIFSITQWHHLAFMIISLALLGYGMSGTFLALAGARLLKGFWLAYLINAVGTGLLMVVCLSLAQRIPFNALEFIWDIRQQAYAVAIYLLLSAPFFLAANTIGLALMAYRGSPHRIYASDLLGAGSGAAAIVGLLFYLAPEDCVIVLSGMVFIAAGLAGLDQSAGSRRRLAIVLIPLGLLSPMIWPPGSLELRPSEYKPLRQSLQIVGARMVSERSGPMGLLTVVESPEVPFRHAPGLSLRRSSEPPEQAAVFTDGDGMTVITRDDGRRESLSYLDQITSALAYRLHQAPKVLVVGAGGGGDVLLARYQGASSVDAVELNPQMAGLLTEDYAEFSGNIYSAEPIRLHIADGRGFVAGSSSRYDLIVISLMDSLAASAGGVRALSENYLYTVEAFEEMLRHLKPGGLLATTRWLRIPPHDGLRLIATAISALERTGSPDPGRRMAVIRSVNTLTLIVKNGEMSGSDVERIRRFALEREFDLSYYPGIGPGEDNRFHRLEEPYLYDGAMALLGADREDFIRRYKFNIRPATDDAPYFSIFLKWRSLPELLSLRERGGLPLVEWGYLFLIATLIQAVLAGTILILLPVWIGRRAGPASLSRTRVGLYFLSLGLGFLFIEIAFIQKLILFLGHPLYALSVALAGFLVFAGLGSRFSPTLDGFCRPRGLSSIRAAAAGIGLLSVSYLVALPPVFIHFATLSDTARIAISIGFIAPLAFLMGMPFPLGISILAKKTTDWIPWAWGVNGAASVLSPVLATILAIQWGFGAVVIAAVLCYGLASTGIRDSS